MTFSLMKMIPGRHMDLSKWDSLGSDEFRLAEAFPFEIDKITSNNTTLGQGSGVNEWELDSGLVKIKLGPGETPSTVGGDTDTPIVIHYVVRMATENTQYKDENGLEVGTLYEWDPLLASIPKINSSTDDIATKGSVRFSSSEVKIIDVDKSFRNNYLTSDDSFYNKPFEFTIVQDSGQVTKFKGFGSSVRVTSTSVLIFLKEQTFRLNQPCAVGGTGSVSESVELTRYDSGTLSSLPHGVTDPGVPEADEDTPRRLYIGRSTPYRLEDFNHPTYGAAQRIKTNSMARAVCVDYSADDPGKVSFTGSDFFTLKVGNNPGESGAFGPGVFNNRVSPQEMVDIMQANYDAFPLALGGITQNILFSYDETTRKFSMVNNSDNPFGYTFSAGQFEGKLGFISSFISHIPALGGKVKYTADSSFFLEYSRNRTYDLGRFWSPFKEQQDITVTSVITAATPGSKAPQYEEVVVSDITDIEIGDVLTVDPFATGFLQSREVISITPGAGVTGTLVMNILSSSYNNSVHTILTSQVLKTVVGPIRRAVLKRSDGSETVLIPDYDFTYDASKNAIILRDSRRLSPVGYEGDVSTNPDSDSIYFRVEMDTAAESFNKTNIQAGNYNDISPGTVIAKLAASAGVEVDLDALETYNTLSSGDTLDGRCRFSIPKLDETEYSRTVDYIEDVLRSTLGRATTGSNDTGKLTVSSLQAPTTPIATIDQSDFHLGSFESKVEYADIKTDISPRNPHTEKIQPIIRNNISRALHGLADNASLELFPIVTETLVRSADLLKLLSGHVRTYSFRLFQQSQDKLVGDTLKIDSELLPGGDTDNISITGIDKSQTFITVRGKDYDKL